MSLRKFRAASHIPTLIKAIVSTEGDILEIGTGYFSTLILHWMAGLYGRHVYSYENDPDWYKRALQYQNEYHHIVLCNDWDDVKFEEKYWGVIFIDHSPHHRRGVELKRLKDSADFIVIHDTESREEHRYRVADTIASMKYKSEDRRTIPYTTIVSNTRKEADTIAL